MTSLLTPLPEAWAALGISKSQLYLLIADGRLSTVRIGRRTLIPTDDLETYVASLRAVKR